jgi:hypothetical protein
MPPAPSFFESVVGIDFKKLIRLQAPRKTQKQDRVVRAWLAVGVADFSFQKKFFPGQRIHPRFIFKINNNNSKLFY